MTIWHFLTFSYITIFIYMHQIMSNCVISSLSSLCNGDIYFSSPDDASCQNYIYKKPPNKPWCLGWVSDCTNEHCWPEMTAALPRPNGPNKQATAASDRVGKTNPKTSRFWEPTSGETTQHGLNDENNTTWMWPSYDTLVTQAASKKRWSWHCGENPKENAFLPLRWVLVSCELEELSPCLSIPGSSGMNIQVGSWTSDIWLDDSCRYGRDGDIPSIIIHYI